MDSQILLIQPWVEDFYITDCRLQPIGLAYLAGSIRKNLPNIDVQIYDSLASRKKTTITFPKEFAYLKRYFGKKDNSPFALFYQYSRYGDSENEIKKNLKEYSPFLIGISCLFTPYYRESLKMAKLCKEIFPDVPIVMGGSHATIAPESLLEKKVNVSGKEIHLCDFVLRGECEESIIELIKYLHGDCNICDVSNLITVSNFSCEFQKKIKVPDRSNIIHPAFDLLDDNRYKLKNKKMRFLITSRSCPYNCDFCSIHSVFGHKYETRKVSDIMEEIKCGIKQGIEHFDVEDDNFTFNYSHALELLNEVIKLKANISFSAMNGLCYFNLNNELLMKMKEAGFENLNLALVSYDKKFCQSVNRPNDIDKLKQVIQSASGLGFNVAVSYIIGIPGQSLQEMYNTTEFLAGEQCLLQVSPFYIIPDSKIHEKIKNRADIKLASNKCDSYYSARLSAMDLECDDFSRDDIYTLWKLSRIINYIKNGIDSGYEANNEYFRKLIQALKNGDWNISGIKSTTAFSEKIQAFTKNKKHTVFGAKSKNKLVFDL